MAASTGPVLIAGGITLANEVLFVPLAGKGNAGFGKGQQPWRAINWRLIPATAGLALALAGLEKIAPGFAVGLAWLLVATVLIVPFGNAPTPIDNINKVLGFTGKALG